MIPSRVANGSSGKPLRPYPVEATGIRTSARSGEADTNFFDTLAPHAAPRRSATGLHRYSPFAVEERRASNVHAGPHRSPPDSPHPRGTAHRPLDLLGGRRCDLCPWLGRLELEDGGILLHWRRA